MADILIKGLDIPKKNNIIWITLAWDGRAIVQAETNGEFDAGKKLVKAIEVPTHGEWHTGTPTEEGWYLLKYGDDFYCANYWNGNGWKNLWCGTLNKWQKIEETD